jgi:hypothetical protein
MAFACVSLWKLEDGVYWGGSVTVYLQSTVSLHKPAIDKNKKYNDDLSSKLFSAWVLRFLTPPPLFLRALTTNPLTRCGRRWCWAQRQKQPVNHEGNG